MNVPVAGRMVVYPPAIYPLSKGWVIRLWSEASGEYQSTAVTSAYELIGLLDIWWDATRQRLVDQTSTGGAGA